MIKYYTYSMLIYWIEPQPRVVRAKSLCYGKRGAFGQWRALIGEGGPGDTGSASGRVCCPN